MCDRKKDRINETCVREKEMTDEKKIGKKGRGKEFTGWKGEKKIVKHAPWSLVV